ncbi:MAG: HlyD family secretion protein [Burkholderiaceae bacterium]
MDDTLPPASTERQPYRNGYRDGFRDGYGEADRRQIGEQKQNDGKDEQKKHGDGGEKDDDEDGDKKDDDKKDDGKQPLYKRPAVVAIALIVILALLIAAVLFLRHSQHHETTDDAFIDGQTSQVAAQVAGRVTKLYVTDNQHVNVGDPLIDIDSRDNDAKLAQAQGQFAQAEGQVEEAQAQVGVRRAAVAEAEANVRQAEAESTKATQDLARYRDVNPDAVARQQVDQAVSAERSARAKRDSARISVQSARAQVEAALAQVRSGRAQVASAKANVDAASLQNAYAHVVAPIAGRVAKRTVEPGNVISNGQALMALVSDVLWVTANYKETQLTEMKPGQSVEIVVDAYPDVTFRGHVDSIQRATGAYFSMLPAENATGNYVKVVQRVPVKIVFDDTRIKDYVIGPGMSVTPNVTLP